MSMFSAEIRRSAEWWKDFQDEDVVCKWVDSALGRTWRVQAPSLTAEVFLSREQVSWLIYIKGHLSQKVQRSSMSWMN